MATPSPTQNPAILAALARLKEKKEKENAAQPVPVPVPATAPKIATANANLLALLAARNASLQKPPAISNTVKDSLASPASQSPAAIPATNRSGLQMNEKQTEFIQTALQTSCVLIGAAGTGKTTAVRELVRQLCCDVSRKRIQSGGHKHLRDGTPGVICSAFTRRATNNIRRGMPPEVADNCITIHKLLEYMPEYYEDWDEKGNLKTKMRFVPNRHRGNPLPSTIHTLCIEESSMVGTDLHDMLMDAIAHKLNIIYLGDIQQLPPVFGPAILGHKLLSLPVIELTEVYRQAMDSPIIRLAHTILRGEAIPLEKSAGGNQHCNIAPFLTLHAWKKTLSEDGYSILSAGFFKQLFAAGRYDPAEDIILMPYNKSFGTLEMNKHIATFLSRHRGEPVHEVICGFQKKYFAIGDKVLYEKEDATIVKISRNMKYLGKSPAKPSMEIDYWGHGAHASGEVELTPEQVDAMLADYAISDERSTAASHVLTLHIEGSDPDDIQEITLDSAGELNALEHGYAITVHKAQGSEWRRVFFVSSEIHNRMLSRELVYTAVTRAREELYVICNHKLFERIVDAQVIKGNTLEQKAEYFKGRYIESN